MKRNKSKVSWSTIFTRGLMLALVWWILTDGSTASWWIGVPAVLLALAASVLLLPPVRMVWFQVLKFAPFFLMRSLLGGADVARRAFQPDLPIDPDLITYRMQLPPGLPQVAMANTVSLLPGTLSVSLDRSILSIHVLDRKNDFLPELTVLEQKMAGIFGAPMQNSKGGD